LSIHGDEAHRVLAQSEQAHRFVDGLVALVADEHANGGSLEKPLLLDVPAGGFEHVAARGREAYEVGRHGAGDERAAGGGGKSKSLDDPPQTRRFERGCRGGTHRRAGILVPDRCQPVGGHGGRKASAGDPPEKSRPRHGRHARRRQFDELVQDLLGGATVFRQSAHLVEDTLHGLRRHRRRHPARRQSAPVRERMVPGQGE
jgi:hypothetical protein